MGSCLSKKTTHCSSPSALPDPPDQTKIDPQPLEKKKPQEDSNKKEIFVIKHRRSHEIDREEKPKSDLKPVVSASPEAPDSGKNAVPASNFVNGGLPNGGVVVRTSSCTKEEVDAILIQCGRLSRSSSNGKANLSGSGDNNGSAQRGRKYSGSKRSYDFDNETSNSDKDKKIGDGFEDGGDEETAADRIHRHRQRHRQSRPSSSGGRRRTPSRERDQQQQRSGSRERAGSGGGGSRRVSRSPGRRSESPLPGANPSSTNPTRPGKMVSVPATVSSMAMDKSNNGGVAEPPPATSTVKRIAVKRNAGDPANTGCRSAASPRSRSPARTNLKGGNENQIGQQPLSLSRSNSRKAEQSPYRRNPLGEIDQNSIGFESTHQPINKSSTNTQSQKPNVENARATKVVSNAALTGAGAGSGPENSKPQGITRSRSSRLSRDLDLNPETLVNPNPSSYTALLLEDIQNFHQKTTTTPAAVSFPACISKACSIVEAVADLNSSSGSSRSEYFNKKRLEAKDPVVESEMLVNDDLMEPSFHKYVTVRKTIPGGGEIEEKEEESSGSNSVAGSGQQYLGSSSTWEPTSADSTDRWTSGTRDSERSRSPLGWDSEARKGVMEKKRDQPEHVGIGRNRVGYSRGLQAAAST